jgi:hypothetical protein
MIGEFCPKVFALRRHQVFAETKVRLNMHADTSAGIGTASATPAELEARTGP